MVAVYGGKPVFVRGIAPVFGQGGTARAKRQQGDVPQPPRERNRAPGVGVPSETVATSGREFLTVRATPDRQGPARSLRRPRKPASFLHGAGIRRDRVTCSAKPHSRINRLKRPGPFPERRCEVRGALPAAKEQKVAWDALCLPVPETFGGDRPASCGSSERKDEKGLSTTC
jgi:hypothetical protein